MFETGYPYIGMTDRYFNIFTVMIRELMPQMDCEAGSHWGICRIADKCENVDLSQKLEFTIGKYDFSIPLGNIATYVNQSDAYYCQTQIALLSKSEGNAIVLGSAFFTAFVGIFDTENDRIGFAESINTLPGSSLKCNLADCTGAVKPSDNPDDSSN